MYPELDLLSSLNTGFNGKNLTQEGLSEINEKLGKFPASSLSTKLKNPSLNKLRQNISEGLHKEFMAVLSRKYGLQDPNCVSTETNTETKTLESARLPKKYGEKEKIFEQTLPGTEDGQAKKLQLGMVEHPTEPGNETRHLHSGSDIKIHQTMVGSASAPIQSADILNLSEENIC